MVPRNISLSPMRIPMKPTVGISANKMLERNGQRLVNHVFLKISQEFKDPLVSQQRVFKTCQRGFAWDLWRYMYKQGYPDHANVKSKRICFDLTVATKIHIEGEVLRWGQGPGKWINWQSAYFASMRTRVCISSTQGILETRWLARLTESVIWIHVRIPVSTYKVESDW